MVYGSIVISLSRSKEPLQMVLLVWKFSKHKFTKVQNGTDKVVSVVDTLFRSTYG